MQTRKYQDHDDNGSHLIEAFQRHQSQIAAACAKYHAEKEGVRYADLDAVKALAFYSKTAQARYGQLLEALRPRMPQMRSDRRAMSIRWGA